MAYLNHFRFIHREKKQTEDFLSQPDLVVTFSSSGDEVTHLSTKYRDAIQKAHQKLEKEKETLTQLQTRMRVIEQEMEKAVSGVELAASKQRRRVADEMEARKARRRRESGEAGESRLGDIETLLSCDDSGIGAEVTNNNTAIRKH